MQKRLISMVLALSMALTAMPLPALAQSAPPDTASAAALAEENGDVTDIFPDDWSGKPMGDPFGGSKDDWSYDEASNTLTLKTGTFRLYNYGYDSYNNCIKWNVKIEPDATLQEARIGSEYHNGYTVTNAGTISGGTFYGKVICAAGAVISGGTFKGNAIVNAAGGEVTIEGGTFEEGSYTSGVTVKAAGTLTINGGTFKGKYTCSVDINNCEKIVINGGSFETSLTDLERTTEIIINGGLFNEKLYVAGDKCTVNGGLFTAENDPLTEGAAINGGYFTAEHTGLVAIDAADAPVYLPVAVAADGTVTAWSADTYSTVYVTPNTSVTLKPTCKLESIVSGDTKLNYNAKGGLVSFTAATEAVQLKSAFAGELVIEASGFPKGTDGGVYGAKGKGWSFEPEREHAELFSKTVPTLIIEKDAAIDFDKVTNKAGTAKFAVENYGTFSGTLKSEPTSDLYVYNRESGTIRNATLDGLNSLYNNGLVEDSVLCVRYIGNGWRETAQPAVIRNSALDITGWLVANSSTYKAVLDGCYNSAGYTGTATIGNGGTVKNSKSTLKLVVENTAGYDGNAKPYQPIIDGGEYTVVYNEDGIIQNAPTIHALVAKEPKDLNGATDYYTLNYTAPEDATYYEKYINGINGMIEGIWSAKVSTLYVDTDQDTISVITHAPIKSVNGVAYSGSVRYDTERYTSTIDLRKYNIPQTHVLNLSATDEGVAALPDADPADFTFALPTNLTYNGNPKTVEVIVRENATKDYGAVTVTYKQDGKVLSGAPVEPGTYTFTAVVAATTTCAGGDVTPEYNTFAILKGTLNPKDFTVTEPTDLTYDGNPKEVTVTNNSTKDYGKITVFYEMSGGKVVHGAPVEPGKYYYSVVTEGSARYKSGSVADGTFTITNDVKPDPKPEPDPADFAFTMPANAVYDGEEHGVTVRAAAGKGYGNVTVTYISGTEKFTAVYDADGVLLSGKQPVNAGDYTFTAVAAATATCAGGDITPQENKFTIQKAELKATDFNILVSYTTVSDGQSYTAYMNEQSPDSPLVLRYGDTITEYKIIPYADAAAKPAAYTAAVMGDYDVLDDNGNKIGTGTGTPTKPGHYRLSIRVTADANHYAEPELRNENWVLDIWRAPLYISDFTVKEPDLTYDGTAKEVKVQNNSDKDYGEITVTYTNDPYNSDGAELDGAPVEPGVYYYTVNAAGGALYEGGLVASGSFRIKEAAKPDPEPDPKPEPKPDPKPEPEPEKTYKITVAGVDVTLPEDADVNAMKAGQLVTLTAHDTATERFAQWVVSGSDGKELTLMDAADEKLTEDAFKQRTLTFRMPAQNLNITAMTTPVEQLPEEESTEFSPLQTVAIVAGTTAWFAGSAVMGYEAVTYSILADLLPKGTSIPRTREQLAVLLWSTAGKPEPAAPAVYSDVAEPDTAKAARWAVEAGLLPDMGEGVFTPGKRVTKVQVIRAWNRLKKLGLAK
ncbi:MAG: hypothetical protein EGR21_10630 [Faecalibacterium prausnitzii]|nr:hypothetical protein [Faecalibacterium prausnitzii]